VLIDLLLAFLVGALAVGLVLLLIRRVINPVPDP